MKYELKFNLTSVLMIALVVAAIGLLAMGHGEGIALIAPGAALTLEDIANEVAEHAKTVGKSTQELKEAHTEITAKMANGEKVSLKLQETVDKMLTDFNNTKGMLTDLEQRISKKAANDEGEKSWGEQFINSESYKSTENRSSRRGVIATEVKTVNSTAAGAGLIRSQRENEIVKLPRERFVLRDLLRTVSCNTSSIDYPVQSTRTNNAAPVAEAAAKPYSDFAWTQATVNVRVLAHLAKITRQAMDDAPRLMGEIDSEMRYGLGYVEERQFLSGSGSGQNLHGIIPQAAAFAVPGGYTDALATRIDVLRLAALQCAIALYPADGIVLNDLDWALIELTKTSEGAYIFANPQGVAGARMWGLPVVTTPAMAADDFLVGNFAMGATIYDRMNVEVLISTENADDFEKNLATVRAEERVAIAVKRPNAFVTGDFTTALGDLEPAGP